VYSHPIQPDSTKFVKPFSRFWKCSKSGEDKQTNWRDVLGVEHGEPGLKGLKRFLQLSAAIGCKRMTRFKVEGR
jgi:hypothetical protein